MFTYAALLTLKEQLGIDDLTKKVNNLELENKELKSNLNLVGEIKSGKLYKANYFDAGQDIFSNEEVIIEPNESKLISTNLYISIPYGHVGLIWARSGLSTKHNLEPGAGCIDCGYTGEVKVHLYNFGKSAYKINIGDRIAQLLTIPINVLEYKQVKEFTCVKSARKEKGYGSTGI